MVLILALLFVHGQSIFAQSEAKQFTDGQYLYAVLSEPEDGKSGTVSIGFNSDSENVNTNVDLQIPNSVTHEGNTYTVTKISESGFREMKNVKSLSIPNTITEIGMYAFCNISFEKSSSELKLPEKLETIRKGAFECQEDENILKEGQFSGELKIPETVTTIEMYAFRGWPKLTGALVIPNSVTKLGQCAFFHCSGFTSVTLSDNLSEIEQGVFYGCSGLSNQLQLPNNIKKLGSWAFFACTNLNIDTNSLKDITFLGEETFAACPNLKGDLHLSSQLTLLGPGCFRDCTGLTGGLTIPNGIKSLPKNVFARCTGLNGTLTFQAEVDSICDNAFENCSSLTGPLPRFTQIKYIGDVAFQNCSKLTGTLPAFTAITSIGKKAFLNCTGIGGDIAFPSTLTTIGDSAFVKTALRIVSIPNSVTAIGDQAFNDCSNITHISLPSNLTSLGSNCMSCKELTIPYLSGSTYAAQKADTVYYMPDALPTPGDFLSNSTMKKLCLKPSLYEQCKDSEALKDKGYTVTDKVSITFPENREYITLCRDFDVDLAHVNESLPEGVEPLKAYIVSGYNADQNELTMQEVTYIPSRLHAKEAEYKDMEKYVGIVLKGKPGYTYYATMGEKDYHNESGQETLANTLPTADTPSLAGASQPKIVNPEETEDGTTYKTYGLKDGKFLAYSKEGVIAYNKAYLRMPQTSSNVEAKPMLLMQFQDMNGTTSVDKVVVPDNLFGDGAIYNLQGMKVKELVKGQIYIKNGQKIMIK